MLGRADIPSGPVNELDEVFADPQVRQRGMVVSVAHPISPDLPLIANPIRFSDTPLTRYDHPPTLAKHGCGPARVPWRDDRGHRGAEAGKGDMTPLPPNVH